MDDKEFAEIIASTKGAVLSSIEKHLAARFYHAIDDVAQETYLRAFNSLVKNKFRGDSSVSTWLYTIARNESLRMNNKLEREEKKFEKAAGEFELIEKRSNTESDPAIDALREKIGLLPPKYRDVMELTSQGFTNKQISERLSIKTGTVKSRTSRAREMLHRIYEGGNHG